MYDFVCEVLDFQSKDQANRLLATNEWKLIGVHNLKQDIGEVPVYILGKIRKASKDEAKN
jgi:hypothetical protein